MANIKVVIVGATGRTGVETVDKLFNAGYEVYALVRNEDKGRTLFPPGVNIIKHELKNYDVYDRIVRGKDVVVYAAGAPATWFGNNTPKDIDYESVRQMAMAADNQDIKQFILISSMGVTHPFHFLNIFGKVLTWKLKGENALRGTNLNYVIIRPGRLIDEGFYPAKCVLYQDDEIHRNAHISREEVGQAVLECIANPEVERVTFELFRDDNAEPKEFKARLEELIPDKTRKQYSNIV